MSRIPSIAVSTGLIGAGLLVWLGAANSLISKPDLHVPLNVLGINRSPYGEVFAMAMQEPVDTYFHGATGEDDDDHATPAKPTDQTAANQRSLTSRFQDLIASMDKATATRTNPKTPSEAHKLYLRRKIEDNLRFAYQLDPSHYANYNTLHLFLTEPQLGTRPQLTASAAQLADETINYCLQQSQDPRPLLTAAGACTNVLQMMFNDQYNPQPKFSPAQMRQYLNLLDYCIGRYVEIAQEWNKTNHWDLLSPQRVSECQERYRFICKIRDASEQIILRIEQESSLHQAAN